MLSVRRTNARQLIAVSEQSEQQLAAGRLLGTPAVDQPPEQHLGRTALPGPFLGVREHQGEQPDADGEQGDPALPHTPPSPRPHADRMGRRAPTGPDSRRATASRRPSPPPPPSAGRSPHRDPVRSARTRDIAEPPNRPVTTGHVNTQNTWSGTASTSRCSSACTRPPPSRRQTHHRNPAEQRQVRPRLLEDRCRAAQKASSSLIGHAKTSTSGEPPGPLVVAVPAAGLPYGGGQLSRRTVQRGQRRPHLIGGEPPGQRDVRAPSAIAELALRVRPAQLGHLSLEIDQGGRHRHLPDQHVRAAAGSEEHQAADHHLEIQRAEQSGQRGIGLGRHGVPGPQRQMRSVVRAGLRPAGGGQPGVTQPIPLRPDLGVRRRIQQQLHRLSHVERRPADARLDACRDGERSGAFSSKKSGSIAAATKTRAR